MDSEVIYPIVLMQFNSLNEVYNRSHKWLAGLLNITFDTETAASAMLLSA